MNVLSVCRKEFGVPRCRGLWLILFLVLARPALAVLNADQLLLVANKNLPASLQLARHYMEARSVPAANLLELDLPVTEAILSEEYDRRLAAPVREYLLSPAGQKTRCVVLLYGVPLHVRSRESTAESRAEVTMIRRLIGELDQRTPQIAQDAETFAIKIGITPRVIGGTGTMVQQQRVLSVADQLQSRSKQMQPEQRREVEAAIRKWQESLVKISSESFVIATSQPADPQKITPQEVQQLANRPRDPEARASLRKIMATQSGAFALFQLLDQQFAWLNTEESDASTDSELALVLLPDFPKYRWQPNPFIRPRAPAEPRVVMTFRIDGPTPQIATRLIDDAVAVEKERLDGTVVFDSRGLPEKMGAQLDGYGWYDQAIRNAASELGKVKGLRVVTDDRMQVILPNTVKDVALYCGWYSLQNYIPSCQFVRGAVGYHVASLELTNFRNPASKEWVPNLLRDGVAATLGAVSEPYLHAFPRPEEFFPILLTGDYTLAETYWLTVPMTSWKLSMIGDPLYRPYKENPPLKRGDLMPNLKAALDKIDAGRLDDR